MPEFPGIAMPSSPTSERLTLQQRLKERHPLLPSAATRGPGPGPGAGGRRPWRADVPEAYYALARALPAPDYGPGEVR